MLGQLFRAKWICCIGLLPTLMMFSQLIYAQDSASMTSFDYQLVDKGVGLLRLDFNQPVEFQVEKKSNQLELNVMNAKRATDVEQEIELRDFATPLSQLQFKQQKAGQDLQVLLLNREDFQYKVTQEGKQVFVKISTLSDAPKDDGPLSVISLNLQNTPVREALLLLAEMSGQDLIVSDAIKGDISLKLNQVPVLDALEAVLNMHALKIERIGDIRWVQPFDLTQTLSPNQVGQDGLNEMADASSWITEKIQIHYANATQLAKVIEKQLLTSKQAQSNQSPDAIDNLILGQQFYSLLSEDGRVSVDQRTNSLIIKERTHAMPAIQQLIRQLDVPLQQVEIETRLVQVREQSGRDLGVRLGFALSSLQKIAGNNDVFIGQAGGLSASRQLQQSQRDGSSPSTGDEFLSVNLPAAALVGSDAASYALSLYNPGVHWLRALDLELSALEVEGQGRILASPKILTLNQQRATIEQGQERLNVAVSEGNSQVTTQKAVLKLSVEPQITPDNEIILQVDIANDNFVDALAGLVSTNRIQTHVRLEDGETMIIGGIYTEADAQSESKVPLIGDLPVLGRLFKSNSSQQERSEMLVFITPRILRPELE